MSANEASTPGAQAPVDQSRIPDFESVNAASRRLAGVAVRTPLLRNRWLDEAMGCQVFLKPECLQHSGSFKFRGAYNRLCQLSDEQRAMGVIAWSSGNHAQGVALAAQLLGIRARIVMPADAPAIKAANTRAYGAEIIPYDRYTQSREQIAWDLAEREGGVIVPSYDDPDIISGQGTTGLELFHDVAALDDQLDALLVCTSGGGLVAGCALAASGVSPATAVYSAEPADFNDHERSLVSGQRESIEGDARSICDALLAPTPGELTFGINGKLLAGGVSVTDDEVRTAIRFAFERLKLVVEPGGAVALAALLAGKVPSGHHRVGVVLSGGNVDPVQFAQIIASY